MTAAVEGPEAQFWMGLRNHILSIGFDFNEEMIDLPNFRDDAPGER